MRYLVQVMATDDSGFSTSMSPNSNTVTIDQLDCCTGYNFMVSASTLVGRGPASPSTSFRTPVDNLSKSKIKAPPLHF